MLNNQNKSEVARLLQQINSEYEAAERGLKGLAAGTARHEFITARTENIGAYHIQLIAIVGEAETARLLGDSNKTPKDQTDVASTEGTIEGRS